MQEHVCSFVAVSMVTVWTYIVLHRTPITTKHAETTQARCGQAQTWAYLPFV